MIRRKRVFETFACSDHEVNRACYRLMDTLQEWSKRHRGKTGFESHSCVTVYDYETEKYIDIIGVGMDIPKYDDTPLFIDYKHYIHTKEDFNNLDVCRLCETFISLLKED